MSGHSKWSTIKHKKGAADAKRGKLFSKLSRAIMVAAKEGGADPDSNLALQNAIEKARSYSMPKDNIERAIAKGAGEGTDGASFETVVYEGYGPEGVAVIVEALTDNRNRTAADVRAAFTKAGGNLGASGSVAFQFERKGEIAIDRAGAPDEEEMFLLVADAGGEDMESGEDSYVVYTAPMDVMAVKSALETAGVPVKGAELVMEPTTPTSVTVEEAKKVLRLVDRLEESDDIQTVYHTMELTDEIAAALEE